MPIIRVRYNESNRRKRNAQNPKTKNKDRKEQGGTEAIEKGWELVYFAKWSRV